MNLLYNELMFKIVVNLFVIITIGTFSANVSFTHILVIISQQV